MNSLRYKNFVYPGLSTYICFLWDNSDLVDGESHSIVVQRTGGNVVTSTEIVGQQPPEDLMQNVECELEEPEGEILLVK